MHPDSNLNKNYMINAKDCRDAVKELNRPRTLTSPWGPVILPKDVWAIFHFTFKNWKGRDNGQSTKFLVEVTIFESIGIFYPKWRQLMRQPSVVQENWREMEKQLKKHEEGIHWERYRKKKIEIENHLKSQNKYKSQDLVRYLQRIDKEHLKEQEIAHMKAERFKLNCR
jgi:predicted secreted Zn-dependent protease